MIFGAVLSAKPYEKMSYKLDKLAPRQSRSGRREKKKKPSHQLDKFATLTETKRDDERKKLKNRVIQT